MKLLLNQIAKTSYLRWCSPDHGYNRILNAQETADRRWTELPHSLRFSGNFVYLRI